MSEPFRCPRHGGVAEPDGCGWCVIDLLTRPRPEWMTPEARAQEVLALGNGPMTTRLRPLWRRIDALVGRPTMTHELADVERLAAEARDWSRRGDWQRRAIEHACDVFGPERVVVVSSDSRDGAV